VLFDKNNRFSYRQDLAKAAAAYLSDKSINVGAVSAIPSMFQAPGTSGLRDVGKGRSVPVLIQVVETFTSGGAGTLKVDGCIADNEAGTSGLAVLASSPAIALATLVAGYKFMVFTELPPGVGAKQFILLQYTIGTAAMTAGKITAGIVWDKQTAGT
jgi:hypothetical protein